MEGGVGESRWARIGLGLLAWGVWGIHAAGHVRGGHPEDLLWLCNVALWLMGLAYVAGAPSLAGVAFACLLGGTPLWLLGVVFGESFAWTSFLTHFGGLWLGWRGMRGLGEGEGVWWKVALTIASLGVVTRVATPAGSNVNLAFAVSQGWEGHFPSHFWYIVGVVGMVYGVSVVMYGAARWLSRRREG